MKKALSLFLSLCMIFSMFAVSGTSYASQNGAIITSADSTGVLKIAPKETNYIEILTVSDNLDFAVSNTAVAKCSWATAWEEITEDNLTYYYRVLHVQALATGSSKVTFTLKNLDGAVVDTANVTISSVKAAISTSTKDKFVVDTAKSKTINIKTKLNVYSGYHPTLGYDMSLVGITNNKNIVNISKVDAPNETITFTAVNHGTVKLEAQYIDKKTNAIVAKKTFTAEVHKGKTVSKKATYFADGYKNRRVCSVCNKVLSKGTTVKKLKLKTPSVKVTAGKKKITVKYTKVKDATGFQVKYTKGNKSYTKKFKTSKSATKSITKLKKGKYKVQVRAYKTSGKKTVYSSYSKAKTVTVK